MVNLVSQLGNLYFIENKINTKTMFKIHEHALLCIPSTVVLHFTNEGASRKELNRGHAMTNFHIFSGIMGTYNQELNTLQVILSIINYLEE